MSRTLCRATLALVVLLPACGARKSAWDQAIADTGCHADEMIVKKAGGSLVKTIGCGEERVYDCDAATHTCVLQGAPTGDVAGDPTAEPPVADEAPAADETAPADAPTEDAPADEASTDEPADDEPADDEPADADAEADADVEAG
jgi:hypothetical protein